MKFPLSPRLVLGLSLALLPASGLGLLACEEAGEGGGEAVAPGDPALRTSILDNLGKNILLPELEAFQALAASLEEAAAAYVDDPTEENRAALEAAYLAANEGWQTLELLQIGPLAPQDRMGDELRYEVYSWPLINACRVDQVTLAGGYVDPTALAKEAANARGLDAIEYLLFTKTADNTCPPTTAINEPGGWDSLDAGEIPALRSAYLLSAAKLIKQQADALVLAYSPDGGDFIGQLRTAGDGSKRYETSQDAFNDWAAALYYLYSEVKDMKVGEPAGIVECAGTCLVEHQYSGKSLESVEANLKSFDRQFFGGERGGDAPGLDDLLADIGEKRVADEIATLLDAAYAAADAIDVPLEVAITDEPAQVQALFDALAQLTDLFKTEVFSLLSLELPGGVASDTD